MSENFRTFRGDEFATFFGFMGAASALVFSCLGYVLSEKERERERERDGSYVSRVWLGEEVERKMKRRTVCIRVSVGSTVSILNV